MITRLFARISILAAMVAIQILVFEKGWGMTPVSWGWIIGVGIFGQVPLIAINLTIDKEDGK